MSTNPRSSKLTDSLAGVTFADTDDWGSGFIGSVGITNTSGSAMNGWTISFDLPETITNIWNAQIVSHVGNHYVITAASWNQVVAPGATISFGFQATGGNPPLPTSAVLNGQTLTPASVTPPPPLPTLAIAGASVTEGSAANLTETFTVTLSSASATPVTVVWQTANGTALAGTDYTAASGTLTFAAGVTSQQISVVTHPGAAGSHAFSVNLTTPNGATLATATATGTIIDPAPPPPLPKLTIAGASVTEGSAANLNETFTVTLSSASATTVTVAWKTANGTAVAGTDYTAASGTLTFAPGVTSQQITVATHPGAAGSHAFSVTLANPSGATLATATATGTIIDPAPVLPTISVANVTVNETATGTTSGGSLLPSGFLSTNGNQIVDANGNPVKISAVNWFGAETPTFSPDGLWAENYKSMMNQMEQLGFNTIRLPFSLQLLSPSSMPNSINYSLNPDLQGLDGLQVLDKIVAYAGQIGMKIILDDHRSAAGSGPNADGLWYDSGYTQQQWISDWQMLAQHYANNPTVIGADLSNEPHDPATWGDGGPNDWAKAATLAGDAIQSVSSNWLIFVEGIQTYNGQSTWWGGNLMGVAQHPVTLTDPNKVVYSPHDYPSSVYDQSWFQDPSYPNNLPAVWNKFWGYIYTSDTAPVWIGEFGTNLQTSSDQQWLAKLVSYMDGGQAAAGGPSVAAGQQGISWAYWSWNPNSSDTGGILQNDWQTVNQAKINAIEPAMYQSSGGSTTTSPGEADFTVKLSAASSSPVTVHYTTVDGTAHAGVDYVATSGNLTFAPGETVQTITTQLLADPSATGSMTFLLALSSPSNGTLASPSATATLVPAGTTTTPPPPPPPPPPTTGTGTAALQVTSDWGSGLTASVTVANQGSAASGQWQVEIDTKDLISNVWNGTILSHQGDKYVVGNASWNGQVAAGGSTSFGFQASETAGASLTAHLLSISS